MALTSLQAHAQNLSVKRLACLPAALPESSGLIKSADEGRWWSLNDGGNPADLLCIDSKGNLIRKVHVKGTTNVDWEELTEAGGFAYIGDFGNNANTRRDLVIYRITHPDSCESDTIVAEPIHFSFSDQHAFPPGVEHQRFDLEAMVVMGAEIHLFTKNRSKPFDGWLMRYRLPASPGVHVAEKVDSVWLGGASWTKGSVCGASISEDGMRLALVGYRRIWVWEEFEGADFWSGKCNTYKLGWAQREAVAWVGKNSVAVTDERIRGYKRGLLKIIHLP